MKNKGKWARPKSTKHVLRNRRIGVDPRNVPLIYLNRGDIQRYGEPEPERKELEVITRTGPGQYKRHIEIQTRGISVPSREYNQVATAYSELVAHDDPVKYQPHGTTPDVETIPTRHKVETVSDSIRNLSERLGQLIGEDS